MTPLLITGTNKRAQHLAPETGCFLGGILKPRGRQLFLSGEHDWWDFSKALTLISASIQLQYSLNPYHLQPRDRQHQDGFTGRDPCLLSTCNPLQIIADYSADASRIKDNKLLKFQHQETLMLQHAFIQN